MMGILFMLYFDGDELSLQLAESLIAMDELINFLNNENNLFK